MKLKWNRQLWNRLVREAPEGFNVSYQNGRIVIAKAAPSIWRFEANNGLVMFVEDMGERHYL